MFSILRKLLVENLARAFIAINLTASTSGKPKGGLISTMESPQKDDFVSKTNSNQRNSLKSMSFEESESVYMDESRAFMELYPETLKQLITIANEYGSKETADWFGKVLEYNLSGGKKNRGLLTVLTYKKLAGKDQLTPENIKKAQYLGWSIEVFERMFFIADDMIDGSITRRGHTCWHKLPNVGMNAINDTFMIEHAVFAFLKNHFRHTECYTDLIELLHEVFFITICGQSLDSQASMRDIDSFTKEMYDTIVIKKTAYSLFYLPFTLGMMLAGWKDPEAFREAKGIMMKIGHFYQVENDYLDCFGNPNLTGKVGTDIQENKCSWLALICMQQANEEQKTIMAECYGHNDPDKIARVKKLYEDLGLPNIFAAHKKEITNEIKRNIQQTSHGVPHELYFQILNMVHYLDL